MIAYGPHHQNQMKKFTTFLLVWMFWEPSQTPLSLPFRIRMAWDIFNSRPQAQ